MHPMPTLQTLLSREQNWVAWKKTGCPSFEKDPLGEPVVETEFKKQKRVCAPGGGTGGVTLSAADGPPQHKGEDP